jgi:hypothetical protein
VARSGRRARQRSGFSLRRFLVFLALAGGLVAVFAAPLGDGRTAWEQLSAWRSAPPSATRAAPAAPPPALRPARIQEDPRAAEAAPLGDEDEAAMQRLLKSKGLSP